MNLERFFSPKSVVIVGVSKNEKKVGHNIAKNMLKQGFSGKLFFVHPSGETILGKKTHTSFDTIKSQVDLAVLAVPADIALTVLNSLHTIGCKNAVIISAGFEEDPTPDGKKRAERLQKIVQKHQITLLGPNCLGFVNTEHNINTTFLKQSLPSGNISIISQSGALGSAFSDYVVTKTHLGVSHFISLGNKSSIHEAHLLGYLLKDKTTHVIGMYLEQVSDPEEFRHALQEVSQKKPVIILKAGRTKEGSEAALSHTGSLVGDDESIDALITQSGAIRADSYAEFETLLKLCSYNAIPKNENMLILSNAGGMGVLLSDEIVQSGLSLVTISKKTKETLSTEFSRGKHISLHNPIDLLGDASAFEYDRAISATEQETNLGAVLVLLTPQANTEIMKTATVLHTAQKHSPYPIIPIFMGKQSVSRAHSFFEKQGMPSFRYFASLAKSLKKLVGYQKRKKMNQTIDSTNYSLEVSTHKLDIKSLFLENTSVAFLNQYDSMKILDWSGIRNAPVYHVVSQKDLARVVRIAGFPLVAKISSKKITHKTEVEGVITQITTLEELKNAYATLTSLSGKKAGCYLQKQFKGHELLVGVKKDPLFNIITVIGVGGIYAELLKQTVQFVHPYSYEMFEYILKQSPVYRFTKEFRGIGGIKPQRLYEITMRLGALLDQNPEIEAIDINPLITHGASYVAVDARVIMSKRS